MTGNWQREFPTRRIKPVDGMAVTAAVWEEAHEYHRLRQRFHESLYHGAGVVTGLEVVATDPPSTAVRVRPGVAVDPAGQVIVLKEPVTYDLGRGAEGTFYLILSYGESRPRADGKQQDGPLYVQAEFGLEARPTWPDIPGVELARVRRQGRDAVIADAQDAAHPAPNEVDLRYRRMVGAAPTEVFGVAVCYVGDGAAESGHGAGMDHVARACARAGVRDGRARLAVDFDVPLGPELAGYALVYLVGRAPFRLGKAEMEGLYAYIQGGGTVLVEGCHRVGDGEQTDEAFRGLLSDLGVRLEGLPDGHRLLTEPYLFAAPPRGEVLVGEGVVFSTGDYGCLWQGRDGDGPARREAIRAAVEWGVNVVAYAVERR